MGSFTALPPSILDFLHGLPWLTSLIVIACTICTWKVLQRVNTYYSIQCLNNFEEDETWDWAKELVLITGGSNGIGLEIVRRLAQRGIKVAIWDLVPPPSDLLKNPHVHFYPVDVTSEPAILSTAKHIRTTLGHPTILINNAGIAKAENILDEDPAHRRLQFEVNVFAQMRLVQEFLPDMVTHNHGHIVTMASESSFISTTKIVTYASTKAAVMAFHEGVGQELRVRYNARKVRTSIVFPHYVRTAMVGEMTALEGFPEMLLSPEYVAEETVKQVLTGKAGRLVLPPNNAYLARLRGFPPWYMYYIHSLDPDVYRDR